MNTTSKLKIAGIATALVIALAFVPAAFAGGGNKHGRKHGHGHSHHDSHHDSWRGGWHGGHHGYVAIPRTIHYGGWHAPYYSSSVYYGPHHHRHTVYRYPVWVDGAVVYRPYAYCGNHLFIAASVPLPQIAIGFTVGSYAPAPYGPYEGGYVYAPPYDGYRD